MPIYEYECFACLRSEEINVPIAQRDDIKDCDVCGNIRYRKISFNGTVWSPTTNGGMK